MSKIVRNIPDGLEASYADIKLDTISDLANLTGTPPDIVWVSGYHTKCDGSYGSHILEWDPDSNEPHNGGTIIELGAPFPTDWSDQTQLDSWFNYSGGTTGRYKLRYSDNITVKMFGAVGDGVTDDIKAIQKTIDVVSIGSVVFPKGNYSTSDTITSRYGKPIKFIGDLTYGAVSISAKHANDIVNFEYIYEMHGFSIGRDSAYSADAITNESAAVAMRDSGNTGEAYSRISSVVTNSSGYYGFYLKSSHMKAENLTANRCQIGCKTVGTNITLDTCAFEENELTALSISSNQTRVLNCYFDGNCTTYDYGNGVDIDADDNYSSKYGAISIYSTYNTFSGNHFNSNNGACKFLLETVSARGNMFLNYDIYYEVESSNHGPTYKFKNAGGNTFESGGSMYFLGSNTKQYTNFYPDSVDGTLGNSNKVDCIPYTTHSRVKTFSLFIGTLAANETLGFGLFLGGATTSNLGYTNNCIVDIDTFLRSINIEINGMGADTPYDITLQVYSQTTNTSYDIAHWTGDAKWGTFILEEPTSISDKPFAYITKFASNGTRYTYRLVNNDTTHDAPNVSITCNYIY